MIVIQFVISITILYCKCVSCILLIDTVKNNSIKNTFQNVELVSPLSNSVDMSRRSSVNSVTSDVTSLFPLYESPKNLYHIQVY